MQLPIRNPKPHLVLFHRERGDGSGAFGRKAGEYPREAGWLHLAERVSRLEAGWDEKRLRKEEIERKLQELKGRVLDPGAVELFLRAEPRLEAGDLFIKEYLRKILPDDHREWTEEGSGEILLTHGADRGRALRSFLRPFQRDHPENSASGRNITSIRK